MNDREVPLEQTDYEQTRPGILATVLGDYRFGEGIRIIHSPQWPFSKTALTEIHETSHLHLCSTTPFGLVQVLLGDLISAPCVPNSLRVEYRRALRATVLHSWNSHEGTASTCELLHALLYGVETVAAVKQALPPAYAAATLPLCRAISRIPIPTLVAHTVVEAVGYCALGTSILGDFRQHGAILECDWQAYFQQADRNPDTRFAVIVHELGGNTLRAQISHAVNETLAAFDLRQDSQGFSDDLLSLPIEKQIQVMDGVRARSISDLSGYMPFSTLPDAEFSPLYRSLRSSWSEELAAQGVRRLATDTEMAEGDGGIEARLGVYLNQLDYAPGADVHPFPDGVLHVPTSEIPRLSEWLRSKSGLVYAHLLYNGTSKTIAADSPLEMAPRGGVLQLHACTRTTDTTEFICPIPVESPERVRATLAVPYGPSDYARIAHLALNVDGVLSLREPEFVWLRRDHALGLAEYWKSPIVVIVHHSGLAQWQRAVQEILCHDRIWALCAVDKARVDAVRRFCIIGSADGTVVLVRPTSSVVAERIANGSSRCEKIGEARALEAKYGSEWYWRLEVACQHYLRYSW